MSGRPSILCPIDFSEASAGALRYAAAIADHFAARLIVLSVEDPLLTDAADLGTGVLWTPEECRQRDQAVCGEDLRQRAAGAGDARVPGRGRQAGAGDPPCSRARIPAI